MAAAHRPSLRPVFSIPQSAAMKSLRIGSRRHQLLIALAWSWAISTVPVAWAQKPAADRHADDRVVIEHARPVSGGAAQAGPPVHPARALETPTRHDRDGDPSIGGEVMQVGFLEDVGHRCSPVCGCDHPVVSGPVPRGGFLPHRRSVVGDPVCGLEVECGVEPFGGIEPGCGSGPGWAIHGSTSVHPGIIEPLCGADSGLPCDCDSCRSACDWDRFPLFLPVLRVNWQRMELFAGSQGYTGPMNFASAVGGNGQIASDSGSFGFYQGINEGRSLHNWFGIDLAAQLGVRATQSNLSGAEFTRDKRQQVFLTAGFFRRVDYGLQYGLVVDYLNEDWHYQADLTQLRGELSWRMRNCDEFGFQFMTGLGGERSDVFLRDVDGTAITSSVFVEPINHYRFFYRWRLPGDGSWTSFGGWSESSHGIFGSQVDIPVSDRISLQTAATYWSPGSGLGAAEHRDEAWSVSTGIVFRPGGPRRGAARYSAPLLPVADNGTFVVGPR